MRELSTKKQKKKKRGKSPVRIGPKKTKSTKCACRGSVERVAARVEPRKTVAASIRLVALDPGGVKVKVENTRLKGGVLPAL